MANGYFERGEVYWVRMDSGFGYEQGVGRPGVILSCDKQNNAAGMVTIAFCSKQSGVRDSWEVEIEATGCTSYVKCSQINTVDKSRLGKCIGVLNNTEMKELDSVLEEFFDLGYVDDTLIKQKDSEIADRDVLIGDLRNEVAGVKTEINKKNEEIASLKMEIEMWQKCYGRCMDMLVDTKVNGDLSRRTAKLEPVVTSAVEEPEAPPVNPPADPPEEPKDDRLDINSCTATALKKVGFSLALARKIVEGRPYKTVEDLKRVNGMKATHYRVMEPKLRCVVVEEPVVVEQPVVNREIDPGFEKLNINAASAQEISEIVGISIPTCYSIVGYRKKNGPYQKLEDLLPVHGVFPGTLKKFEGKFEFGEAAPVVVEEVKPVVVQDGAKVNVNTASAQEIHDKTGLAMCACYAITGKRKRDGLFKSLDELEIPGRLSAAHLAKFLDKMEV